MRLALVVGSTATAMIPGISAAGADTEAMWATPAADAELVTFGHLAAVGEVPVSPSGCPTPALVTRAVRDVCPFDLTVVAAGLRTGPAAPTAIVGTAIGGDIRTPTPVPAAHSIMAAARSVGRSVPDDELLIGESIPGGTTTAFGVLRALGEDITVSSSLPENPLELKRAVVAEGLEASRVSVGALEGRPLEAVTAMGDPVLAAVAGLARGCLESGTRVTLAGGTQLLAAAAVLRHAGVTDPLTVATTSFVASDPSTDLHPAAQSLDVDLIVTDPGFDRTDHPAFSAFERGEAKEGVGMGGALMLADGDAGTMAAVRERVIERYRSLIGPTPEVTHRT